MLELVYSTIKDTLLQVIIPILIGQANIDLQHEGIYDTNYVCSVRFEEAVLFARNKDWEGFEILESSDSAYLTEVFDGYFEQYDEEVIEKLVNNNDGFVNIFLRFHYGRTWLNNGALNINIVLNPQREPFTFGVIQYGKLIGSLILYPYFNDKRTAIADTIISRIGFNRFYNIFVLLHEIGHLRDYLTWKKYNPDKKVPRVMNTEAEIDRQAYVMLKRYFPNIQYIVTRGEEK